jgi:hypothetical protein
MALMRPILLIAGALILAAGLILLHLRRRKNGSSYQGGPRAANTELIRSLPEYKRIRAIYAVLSFLLEASLITACLSAMVLAARPFRTEVIRGEEKKRDIFLCLDVSYSIYDINYQIVDSLEEMVRGLDGDRFGICIYNTTSVVYVPMTDDYEYVIEKLEDLKEIFRMQKQYMEEFGDYEYYSDIPPDKQELYEELERKLDYELGATLVNNLMKGSSLIGEGVCACLMSFPRLEEAERTRAIIMVTDNCQMARSTPIAELRDAMELCAAHDVRVYAVFPEDLEQDDFTREEYLQLGENYRRDVESIGGIFYSASDSFPGSQIVASIQKEEAKSTGEIVETRAVDQPVIPAAVLLISLLVSSIIGVILRK